MLEQHCLHIQGVAMNTRPEALIRLYWQEVLVIEENATWDPVQYLEAA